MVPSLSLLRHEQNKSVEMCPNNGFHLSISLHEAIQLPATSTIRKRRHNKEKEYRTVYPIQVPHQKRALSSCYLPYAILNKRVISSIFRLLMYRLHGLCSIYTSHSLDILIHSLPNHEIFSCIFSQYLQTYGFE
jgi:hypothetical protein